MAKGPIAKAFAFPLVCVSTVGQHAFGRVHAGKIKHHSLSRHENPFAFPPVCVCGRPMNQGDREIAWSG